MEYTSFAVALIILAVARLGNCAAVDRELRRIKHKIINIQDNINGMQRKIEELEFDNRELRNDLEGEKNRTSQLEKQLNSASSKGPPAVTDNVSRGKLCNSYTMVCPPVRGNNPRALVRTRGQTKV